FVANVSPRTGTQYSIVAQWLWRLCRRLLVPSCDRIPSPPCRSRPCRWWFGPVCRSVHPSVQQHFSICPKYARCPRVRPPFSRRCEHRVRFCRRTTTDCQADCHTCAREFPQPTGCVEVAPTPAL